MRPKMKKSLRPKYLPTVEIPNTMILGTADDFAQAAESLLQHRQGARPIYVLSCFAIELYLKSLRAEPVYTQSRLERSFRSHEETARVLPNADGRLVHYLDDLYRALDNPLKHGLRQAYKAKPVVKEAPTILKALMVYSSTFVAARYSFEYNNSRILDKLQRRTINELLALMRLIGDYVRSYPKHLR